MQQCHFLKFAVCFWPFCICSEIICKNCVGVKKAVFERSSNAVCFNSIIQMWNSLAMETLNADWKGLMASSSCSSLSLK